MGAAARGAVLLDEGEPRLERGAGSGQEIPSGVVPGGRLRIHDKSPQARRYHVKFSFGPCYAQPVTFRIHPAVAAGQGLRSLVGP